MYLSRLACKVFKHFYEIFLVIFHTKFGCQVSLVWVGFHLQQRDGRLQYARSSQWIRPTSISVQLHPTREKTTFEFGTYSHFGQRVQREAGHRWFRWLHHHDSCLSGDKLSEVLSTQWVGLVLHWDRREITFVRPINISISRISIVLLPSVSNVCFLKFLFLTKLSLFSDIVLPLCYRYICVFIVTRKKVTTSIHRSLEKNWQKA